MRQVLSVSLPGDIIKSIKKRVKDNDFGSVSEYFKYLFEMDDNTISEEELLLTVEEARKEYKAGKSVRAKSVADFL